MLSYARAQRYLRWATVDMSWKEGGCCAPFAGELCPRLITMWPRPSSTTAPNGILSHPAIWPQNGWMNQLSAHKWTENWVGAVPFCLGGAQSPKSPKPKPTSIPSGILIHPAVWPQRTWAENLGLCPLRGGGAGSSSNTMSEVKFC